MLSRRDFIPASASLVGVALAGSTNLFASERCTTNCTPPRPVRWSETVTTVALRTKMETKFTTLKVTRSVRVLTAAEWDTLGTTHQTYWTNHAGLGHLHAVDLAMQARQAELKTRFGVARVDYILEHGTFACLTQASAGFHAVASKLRGEAVTEVIAEINDCAVFWAVISALIAIVALLTAGAGIAPMLELASIVDGLIGAFIC